MRRRVFDLLASVGGVLLVVILLAAGGLLIWAYTFTNDSVHNQLSQQEITFPAKGSSDLANPRIGPYLNRYAGQRLTTGPQAKAYADHFIAVHLSELPMGGVYSKISAAAQANPNNAQLKSLQTTAFQGTTLRGLLLSAYAFSVFGVIAMWSAVAAFIAAFLLAVLVAFGFWHARRTPHEEELLAAPGARVGVAH